MRWILTLALLALAACQAKSEAPRLPRGDEILPGAVEVVGLTYCDVARLELAAIVLDGPPRAAALADVADARAPGCTWVTIDGDARVRLNVYDTEMRRITGASGPDAQYKSLVAARARVSGQGVELPDLGIRAARFGFTDAQPEAGAIVVETPELVVEFDARGVKPAKLAIFAREVTHRISEAEG